MKSAHVSIIVPFLNPPTDFFREALESATRQTYPSWELILVNDGSGGDAQSVAQEFQQRFPDQVRLIRHADHRNHVPRESRRIGFEAAQGRYIAFLDADDWWMPDKLCEQVALLEAAPGAGMLYGSSLYWASWSDPRKRDFQPQLGVPSGTIVEPPILVRLFLNSSIAVPCPSAILARRDAVEAAGAFKGPFEGIYEDQVFLAMMCIQTPVLVVDQCWDRYRLHDRSTTSRTDAEIERENRRCFLEWFNRFLEEREAEAPGIREAVQIEIRKLQHPLRTRVGRILRKSGRRLIGRTVAREFA
jgi:glycosyltransferase involved in cell wall biosynthesis